MYVLKSRFSAEKLERTTNKLKRFWKKHGKLILSEIEKETNLKWFRKEIKVFLFSGYHQSIPNPLLLNDWDGDKDFLIFDLTRMLINLSFIDNGKYTFNVKIEDLYSLATSIALKILEKNKLINKQKILRYLCTYESFILSLKSNEKGATRKKSRK